MQSLQSTFFLYLWPASGLPVPAPLSPKIIQHHCTSPCCWFCLPPETVQVLSACCSCNLLRGGERAVAAGVFALIRIPQCCNTARPTMQECNCSDAFACLLRWPCLHVWELLMQAQIVQIRLLSDTANVEVAHCRKSSRNQAQIQTTQHNSAGHNICCDACAACLCGAAEV